MRRINKKYAIIVILILLIGGGAAWHFSKKSTPTIPGSEQTSQTIPSNTNTANGNVFNPLATSGSSYMATITTTASGNTSSATMSYDKTTGDVQYTGTSGGQSVNIVYTKDTYYICESATTCISYPLSGNTPAFNPSTYEYTDAQLSAYRAGAAYQGKQSCPAGTCDVWKVSNGGYDSSLFIDSVTHRISQVEGTSAAGTSKVVYNYQNVTVAAPTNATAAPTYP